MDDFAWFSGRLALKCKNRDFVMEMDKGRRKIINHNFVQGNPPSCHIKDLHNPLLGKPRRGLQIFDTRVDFPVPAQSCGRVFYSYITPNFFAGGIMEKYLLV